MITEKRYLAIPPRAFVIDGGTDGAILLSDTIELKVGQTAILRSSTQQPLRVKINRVASNQLLYVGDVGKPVEDRVDVSAYTTADTATLEIPEQKRTSVPQQEIERLTYDEEPIIARRTVSVDPYGRYYTVENPVPVQLSDGSIDIGTVNAELEVQLSHVADFPDAGDVPDSVRIGDGEDELQISDRGEAFVTQGYSSVLPLIANIPWIDRSNYDELVQQSVDANTTTFTYKENGAEVGLVTLDFNQETGAWNFTSESYLVNPDGEQLLDDDGTGLELS